MEKYHDRRKIKKHIKKDYNIGKKLNQYIMAEYEPEKWAYHTKSASKDVAPYITYYVIIKPFYEKHYDWYGIYNLYSVSIIRSEGDT